MSSYRFLIWIVCFVMLCGCKNPQHKEQTIFLKYTDSYNREVVLEKEPQRIISLSPAITELLFMIDAGDRLVGISDYCNYPEETKKIPKVGGMQNINMETMLSLHPDVVLIGSMVSQEDVDKIEKLNIPVIALIEESDITGISTLMLNLGKITSHDSIAKVEADRWQQTLENFRQNNIHRHGDPKSVYYVVGFGETGDFTAPKGSHINQIIELAGCRNVGEEVTTWNVSREFLFQADPDIIVVRKEDMQNFCSMYPYTQLKAVKENKVYPIESSWIDIVTPRNLHAIAYLQHLTSE
ncbi:MAG: ABC transporter substrate-binding protein [Bacteroidales bacterium]|nr:ABC transporter substrate-binding protein [Bacteroidales bacterium]